MPVCGLSRLRTEAIVCIRVARIDLLVIWNDGEVAACERACPHEQADLGLGHTVAGRLVCPRHAASFDLGDVSNVVASPEAFLRSRCLLCMGLFSIFWLGRT